MLFDLCNDLGHLLPMRLMTQGERQLLIGLCEEYPVMRDELQRKLVADNQLRRETEQAEEAKRYERWRAREVKRLSLSRKIGTILGLILTIGGCAAVCRVGWLLATNGGGSLPFLALFSFLALLGGDMWLGRGQSLSLPPTHDEITRQVDHFGDVRPTPPGPSS